MICSLEQDWSLRMQRVMAAILMMFLEDDFTGYVLMHHQPWKKFMYNVSIRAGASSAYDIPLIYSLDARYLFTKSLSLRGAYSTNYRLPTFNDLYWEPGGNPELKPEFSSSGEIGLDFQLKNFK